MIMAAKRKQITQQIVKELFDYNEGYLYWKIKPNSKIEAGSKAGSIAKIKNGALAYNRAAVKYFGEFANLNIVQPVLS